MFERDTAQNEREKNNSEAHFLKTQPAFRYQLYFIQKLVTIVQLFDNIYLHQENLH